MMVAEGDAPPAPEKSDNYVPLETQGQVQIDPGLSGSSSHPPLLPLRSKKSLKREAKGIKWEQTKKLKRWAEKQKMKKKRLEASGVPKPLSRKTIKKNYKPIVWDSNTAPQVVVDLSFDQLMTYQEKSKTAKQLLRSYTLNRRAANQLRLYFAGMKPDTESFTIFERNDGYKYWDVKMPQETYLELFPKEKIVYLTSDSDNDDVYVIGGLVDHNRRKGHCFDNAQQLGIRHARLPIKEHIVLKSRTVLTIEQVFNILLKVHNGMDWKSTLLEVVPLRKGAKALTEDDKSALSGLVKKEEPCDLDFTADDWFEDKRDIKVKKEEQDDDEEMDIKERDLINELLIKKEIESADEDSDNESSTDEDDDKEQVSVKEEPEEEKIDADE